MLGMINGDFIKLENVDPGDISDVLIKIEKSFGIQFRKPELKDVKTFGELCDIIVSKIKLLDSNGCTTQQAFYKLRNAISKTLSIDKIIINPDTQLNLLFPKQARRKTILQVEKELGFSLKLLRPKHFITGFYAMLFLASLFGIFVSWQIGLIGIISSSLGMSIADRFGKEFKVHTVSELIEKMGRENYMKSRRNNKRVNKAEVVRNIEQLFSSDLGVQLHFLTRDAVLS